MDFTPPPAPPETPPETPQRSVRATFQPRMDAFLRWMGLGGFADWLAGFVAWLVTFQAELTTTIAGINAAISGGGLAMDYTFDSTTTDSDPGAGKLRLGSATQNTATVLRLDLTDRNGVDQSNAIDLFDDSSSSTKGFLTIHRAGDGSHFLVLAITALASPSGYRNVSCTVAAASSANPFTNGDALTISFVRNGDKGDQGVKGDAGQFAGVASGATDLLTGASIAGSSTPNLNTRTGDRVHITGSGWNITGWTLTRGPVTVIFDGSGTLTHDATSNNLPGAATILVSANDRAVFEGDGTKVWCVAYTKADGTAVIGSGASFGTPLTATVVASLGTSQFTSARLTDTLSVALIWNNSTLRLMAYPISVNLTTGSVSIGTGVAITAANQISGSAVTATSGTPEVFVIDTSRVAVMYNTYASTSLSTEAVVINVTSVSVTAGNAISASPYGGGGAGGALCCYATGGWLVCGAHTGASTSMYFTSYTLSGTTLGTSSTGATSQFTTNSASMGQMFALELSGPLQKIGVLWTVNSSGQAATPISLNTSTGALAVLGSTFSTFNPYTQAAKMPNGNMMFLGKGMAYSPYYQSLAIEWSPALQGTAYPARNVSALGVLNVGAGSMFVSPGGNLIALSSCSGYELALTAAYRRGDCFQVTTAYRLPLATANGASRTQCFYQNANFVFTMAMDINSYPNVVMVPYGTVN